ncbi:hypothetical protein ACHAQA_005129 [Verticillium albo-atrum]
MASISLRHGTLGATLLGIRNEHIAYFRGIEYARVPHRFAAPVPTTRLDGDIDCREFGPRCPQLDVDSGHLLRIPSEIVLPKEAESEFLCTNLDVCVPNDSIDSANAPGIPVMVWIHGGSQALTFGSAKSGICDPSTLVMESTRLGKPMIVVNVQYRVNVLALGDGNGPSNLALLDQRAALDWVKEHIAGFGGDPSNVTVYGESAGAVYAHAHLVMRAPAKQYILSSGCLYLSPPQPAGNVGKLRNIVQDQLRQEGQGLTLQNASVTQIVDAIRIAGINSWVLQEEDYLEGWQGTTGHAARLLMTDVAKEAVIWQRGLWQTGPANIAAAFEQAGALSGRLKKLYHIDQSRPTSCSVGALDFISDLKFVLPLELLRTLWDNDGKPSFRALVDEQNPWQPSAGSHHGVDLLLLWGGFDLDFAPAAQITASHEVSQKV